MATPDRVHLLSKGYSYFRISNYFGVSCFQQISAEKAKDQKDQITRSTVQKSVVVISTKPFYGAIRFILDPCTEAYFNHAYFEERDILIRTFEQLTTKFNRVNEKTISDNRDSLFLGVSLKQFIRRFGRDALTLYKLMWLEKKIIFYDFPPSEVCDNIVAVSSLLPHFLFSLSPHVVRTPKEMKEAKDFALPLTIFDTTYLAPYVSLHYFDFLQSRPSFIIGSSNRLFVEGSLAADVIVTEGTVKFNDPKLEKLFKLHQRDRMFIDRIISTVKTEDELHEKFEGSDLWIRSLFNQYTLSLLSVVVKSNFESDLEPLEVFNESWIEEWKKTKNYSVWKDKVSTEDVVQSVRPVHFEHDTKTELDELQEAVSQQATKVSNYLMSIYENQMNPSTQPPTDPTSQDQSSNSSLFDFSNFNIDTTEVTSMFQKIKDNANEVLTSPRFFSTNDGETQKIEAQTQTPQTPQPDKSTLTIFGSTYTVPSKEAVTSLFDSFWSKKS
uniref:UDENN domain-containing protein n=1 Tax=Arcella intermedia TaxID=1963864 RepID=A0A6B2L1L5_9EUKA